ncbi:hypothetical protein [Gemmata sp.]|uniref:hypothetical protein n=1 Tax=Gemmata sp. TaxID=1914242 RepID=UPI003F712636
MTATRPNAAGPANVVVRVVPLPSVSAPETWRTEVAAAAEPPSVRSSVNDTVAAVRTVAAAPSATGSLSVWAPVVATAPPLIAVVPPASVVRLASGVPPTGPPNVVAPEEFTARACPPETELANVTGPAPAERVASAASVTAPAYTWPAAPVVVTVPP